MKVMNPVCLQKLQEQINGISKDFFNYSRSINDQDFRPYKPPNGLLRIEQEKSAKTATTGNKHSRFLIAWGCGEFGQHGLDQSGDVTHEMAMSTFKSGDLMLPNDEAPVSTVCGSSHTLVLTGEGKLYSWGNGTSGQLGNGSCKTTIKPTLVHVELAGKIQGMSCGARHSFIWTENGYCYSFGNNFNAQLGYNFSTPDFKENQLEPVLVELLPDMKVKEVACGARHSLFLLTTGRVMGVGHNQHGQIGNDTMEDVVIPTLLDDLESITHISCGNIHSLASHESGTVYAWGYGKAFGNKTRHVITPQRFIPQNNQSSTVVSLTGGDSHSMVLYDNGILFTWGNNYEGQLGVGKDIKYQNQPEAISSDLLPRPVIQIASGETTSAAVTGTGQLFMWGKNASLICSEKPSQCFQYSPHHIELEGLFVKQISCGAWHVSAIITNSGSEIENSFQNVNNDSPPVELQPVLMNRQLNLVKIVPLGCKGRDNMSLKDTAEQQLDYTCGEQTLDNDTCDSLMDTCFITTSSSHSESETTYSAGNDNEVLGSEAAGDKPTKENSEKVFLPLEQEDCLVGQSLSLFHGEDKTVCRSNGTKETEIMDSTVGYDNTETYKDFNLRRRCENEFQMEEAHCLEKVKGPCNTSLMKKFVSSNGEEKLTDTGLLQNEVHVSYYTLTEDITLQKNQGNGKNYLSQNEKETTSCSVESQNVCSMTFQMDDFRLENDRRKNKNTFIQDKDEDLQKDNYGVKDNHFLSDDSNVGERKANRSFYSNYCEGFERKNILKDAHLRCINDKIEADITENKKSTQSSRQNILWHNVQDLCEKNPTPISIRFDKKPSSLNKLAISAHSSELSLNSFDQAGTLKHNLELKQIVVIPPQNKSLKTSQVVTQQQTMPVIDLRFGKTLGNISGSRQTERNRIKPSFTTFRNVWKASTLFREKQRQKTFGNRTSPESDLVFNLENMLPHRPIQAARETEKTTKLKEDSMKELRTKTIKLSNNSCCHDRLRAELLPPICSCKKNGVQPGQGNPTTNVFINKR